MQWDVHGTNESKGNKIKDFDSFDIMFFLPFNTVSNGPKKCGCNNEVTLLTKVFLKENAHGRFCRVTPKKVAVGRGSAVLENLVV